MIEAKELRLKSNLGVRGLQIVAKNELIAFFRSKGLLASQLIQPILYIVFIVIGLHSSISSIYYKSNEVTYAEYTTIGIIGLLIINQMTQVIYRVTIDKKYGLLALKLCSGVKPTYYIFGMSVYPLIGLIIQEIVIYIISILSGIDIAINRYIIITFLSVVILLFWNSIGILITMFINDYRRRDIVIRFLLTPLGFTAPVFYIMDSAPKFVQLIGKINPLTYQLEILRDVYFNIPYQQGIILIFSSTLLALIVTVKIIPKIKIVLLER